ncbi:glucose-1-phosphate adenylyltransferase [Candidatus Cetobacterium colombiensis]|uniref:Glucose-1-phosphate adenylyltransferase n=1 Tax=Candidatus Cetobacterium colombiensis TaxID=3073100 RepID=A0ABU4W8K3_9FUSO|nr:glucose-1-phosphate adenylyltransferase [Candidatus Cetobacterium colombiensis]MDX8335861.1 glucose-1-phosphate adenylyltransferase [Candidatus Cetobacterium colombiensis]
MKKKMIAMILAGGQGSRLKKLTKDVAKPAVPFGGKYRIIDFPLSNCVNSGIDTVGVLVQYKPFLLNRHIGVGSPWDLDVDGAGVSILPPYSTENENRWYKGTADAIFQNENYIDMYNPEYILILSGDHIYKMDYDKMLDFHIENGAKATVAVIDVLMEEASRFGIMNTTENGEIYEFEEKPKEPKSTLASMGIYIFNWSLLKQALKEDQADKYSDKDFGKNIIPKLLREGQKLMAYPFAGYWKDVGTIESLWAANMDLLDSSNPIDLFDKNWRIYSQPTNRPGHLLEETAVVKNSIISEGCIIKGEVINSILSSEVIVEEGARIHNSVILSGAVLKKDSFVNRIILGENVVVDENEHFGKKDEILFITKGDE